MPASLNPFHRADRQQAARQARLGVPHGELQDPVLVLGLVHDPPRLHVREVRRLRGEIGRTIWNEAEEQAFKAGLGGSKALSALRKLKVEVGSEGDFRWPQTLLLASQQQAHTGQSPVGLEWDYRFGASDGGFDKLAFKFEFDMDPAQPPIANPQEVDLSLPLNRRGDGRPDVSLP